MSDLPDSFIEAKEEKEKREQLKKEVSDFLVDNFIPTYTNKREQYEKWFRGYLKNYIVENEIDYKSNDFYNTLLHTCDYLNSAQAKARFDRMTWDVAQEKVKTWDEWLQKRLLDGDDPENAIFVCELKKGFKIVELNSQKCLSYEGASMGHCVGSYWNKVENGNIKIFSLRDKKDNPHATIEYSLDSEEIVQVQGKENKRPIDKYLNQITEFTKQKKISFSQTVARQLDFRQIGWTYVNASSLEAYKREVLQYLKENPRNEHGGLLDLTGVPEVTEISGNWDRVVIDNSSNNHIMINQGATIHKLDSSKNIELDENVFIHNLSITNSTVDFDERCEVHNLQLKNSTISVIPDIKLRSLTSEDCTSLSRIDGRPTKISITNSPLLKEIPESKYLEVSLNNVGVENVDNLESISVSLANLPLKEVDVSKFYQVSMENLDIESIDPIDNENFKHLKVSNCNQLTRVGALTIPHAKIEIRGCKNLKELQDVKGYMLDLNTSYVEDISRINVHRLDIRYPKNPINLGRRIRVKELKTNSKSRKQLRSRDLDERRRDRSRRR